MRHRKRLALIQKAVCAKESRDDETVRATLADVGAMYKGPIENPAQEEHDAKMSVESHARVRKHDDRTVQTITQMSREMHEQILEEVRVTDVRKKRADIFSFLVPEAFSKMLNNLIFLIKDDRLYEASIKLFVFLSVLLCLSIISSYAIYDVWIKGDVDVELTSAVSEAKDF